MGTKQFDNYADLITFTRASGGTALRPISYGSELVTNGTFDTDTSGWSSFGSGITISWSSGRLRTVASTSNGTSGARQVISGLIAGKAYLISAQLWDITASATNGPTLRWGNGDITSGYTVIYADSSANENGLVVSGVVVPSGTTITVSLVSGGSGGSLTAEYDNISVKEVLFDQPNAPLTLFNHPTNIPRIEYDADGNRLGLLVEEQRTNLLKYSSEFDQSPWAPLLGTITANTTVAPDGTTTADTFTEDSSGTDGPRVYDGDARSFTSGQTYTLSCFMKAGTASYGYLSIRTSGGNIAGAVFDLSGGTVDSTADFGTATYVDSGIENVGSGWYRCFVVVTAGATVSNGIGLIGISDGSALTNLGYPNYTLTGLDIYLWGAQLEAGSFPTSYIPTSGSTATRAADVATIPVTAFGYNQTAGTVVVTGRMFNVAGTYWFASLGDVAADSIQHYTSASAVRMFVRTGGVDQAAFNTGNTLTNNVEFSFASAFAENDLSTVLNGGAAATDTSALIPRIDSRLGIGASVSLGSQLNGHIKSIKYYPRRLSNAQLQELTQ